VSGGLLFMDPLVTAIWQGRKTQTRRVIPELAGHVGPFDFRQESEDPLVFSALAPGLGEPIRFRAKHAPGEVLAVREAWSVEARNVVPGGVVAVATAGGRVERPTPVAAQVRVAYRAFGTRSLTFTGDEWTPEIERQSEPTPGKWRPSIFFPTWAVRLRVRIRSVRPERLHAITADDVRSEGVNWHTLRDLLTLVDRKKRIPTELAGEALEAGESGDLLAMWRVGWMAINGRKSWDSDPLVLVYEFEKATSP
jgi:hypothetical protein